MNAIETDGLRKEFGEFVAVNDVDLDVAEGEVFGFLGRNGAGKSTTINMLLGFLDRTAGSVEVLGHDPQTDAQEIRKRVGILPEGAELYERLTGREHLEMAIELHDADVTPEEILDRVGLDADDADRKAGGYSKGMGQRLGLGMALVGDPELLILDEPSSGLDPHGMQEIRDLVREEAESGTAVFFSSHLMEEVEAVCDRVAILKEGELVVKNTIEGLRNSTAVEAEIELEVDAVPDPLTVGDVNGVTDVRVDGDQITVSCEDSSIKADVVTHLAERTAVLEIISNEASLESLFTSYTTGEDPRREERNADGDAPPTSDADAAAEVAE
jgi:ABC-2 type transport system ATP-binding protein